MRAGQASALAEGGPQTVIKLLECSLWPAAAAAGCRAITALARTRKQKVTESRRICADVQDSSEIHAIVVFAPCDGFPVA